MSAWSLADLVREPAAERPHRQALASGDETRTFAQLDERSSRVAQALTDAGVGRDDRVAVLVANGCAFFELVFGAAKVDATLVALNWRLAAPEIAAILADAGPAVLVCDPRFAGLVATQTSGMRVVALGPAYERWLAAATAKDPRAPSAPDSMMLVLYSSGTTGLPKGIMLTNRNLSYIPAMARELFRMDPDSVHLVGSPVFHVAGAVTGLTATSLGGRTVLLGEPRPDMILEAIERERVTHAFFVPAVIQRLIESPQAAQRDLSSLRYLAYGAAPMTQSLLRRALDALGCGFIGCYGMTETGGTVTHLPPEAHVAPDGGALPADAARRLASVGRPLSWHEVRVTDLETQREAAPGTPGEIWVRSPMNTPGYLGRPRATAETLAPGGWLRTGDGAYRDEDGYLFLTDRIKDMIITGGENVYPAEVENVLAAHPDVSEVAVIGVPDPRWGETVKAVVAPRAGVAPSAVELIAHARGQLARYKCPTSVELVDELPRNPSGKVVKQALRERYSGRPG